MADEDMDNEMQEDENDNEAKHYDWSAHYDDEGKLYYYNSSTGESAWDPPEEGFNPPAVEGVGHENAEDVTNDSDAEENPQEETAPTKSTAKWEKHKDESGNEYYFNPETGETTWDTPTDGEIVQPEDSGGDVEQQDSDQEEGPSSPTERMDIASPTERMDIASPTERMDYEEEQEQEPKKEKPSAKWEAHKDEEGNEYYYNTETCERQWDKPEGEVIIDASAEETNEQHNQANDGPSENGDALHSKWVIHKDDDGNDYYFNTETGETQWEKPDEKAVEIPPQEEAAEPDKAPATWIAHTDEDGKCYYYNQETGETQWEMPDGKIVDASDVQSPVKPDQPVEGEGATSATATSSHWELYKDGEGREYYYNTETGETSWDKPDNFESAEAPKSPSAADDENKIDEDDENKIGGESKQEEEEIDPAVKRQQEAEAFLAQTDSILEPACFANVTEVVTSEGGNATKAMTALVENYQAQTAVCGLLAKWLSNMKSASSATKTKTKEESSEATNNEIRKSAQEVINRIAKERFSKEAGDAILYLSKAEAEFLEEMIDSSRWRTLLIDLSASHKDSAVLMYCLQSISKRGHHREIARRINQSDHFSVFRQMLQSELTVIGKLSVSSGSDVTTSIGMEELIDDLRRACTATSYTYLYSLEVLRALGQSSQSADQADSQLARAFRKWEVIREELENTMQDPAVSANFGGSSPLFRKRRLDIALTINELHQRQRRRFVPPSDSVDRKGGLDSTESALHHFIRQYANNVQINESLLDPLLPSGLDLETHKKVGELLTKHPLAIRAMMGCLFKPGTSRVVSPSLKNKCARLIALAVIATEEAAVLSDGEIRSSDEVAVQRTILQGCQLCEQLEIMVSFLVTDADSKTTTPSPGRKLCDLANSSSVVAQGTLLWARELTNGPEFAGSASFPTLSVSILSLVRRIAMNQPFTRRDALSVALALTKQYNPDVSYQKLNAIKEQSIRLMICLMAKGEVSSVLAGVANRLAQQPELDASLVRYFVSGLLEIVKVPVSVVFARVLAHFLRVPKCVDAVRSSYFVEPHKTRLTLLLKSFKQLLVEDDKKGKVDKSWLESVLSTYRLE